MADEQVERSYIRPLFERIFTRLVTLMMFELFPWFCEKIQR